MSTKTYILTKQVHFSTFKSSFPKGSKFDCVQTPGGNTMIFNGEKIENPREIEIAIKAGFAIPFIDGKTKVDSNIKTLKRAEDKKKKFPIDKSDADQMRDVIDISHTKNEVIKEKKEKERAEREMSVAHEENTKTIRGLKVINSDASREKSLSNPDSISAAFNTDEKTVRKIGEHKNIEIESDEKLLTAIENSEKKSKPTEKTIASLSVKKSADAKVSQKAMERAAARKKQAEASHKKPVEQTAIAAEESN